MGDGSRFVSCPLCDRRFHNATIEHHASHCQALKTPPRPRKRPHSSPAMSAAPSTYPLKRSRTAACGSLLSPPPTHEQHASRQHSGKDWVKAIAEADSGTHRRHRRLSEPIVPIPIIDLDEISDDPITPDSHKPPLAATPLPTRSPTPTPFFGGQKNCASTLSPSYSAAPFTNLFADCRLPGAGEAPSLDPLRWNMWSRPPHTSPTHSGVSGDNLRFVARTVGGAFEGLLSESARQMVTWLCDEEQQVVRCVGAAVFGAGSQLSWIRVGSSRSTLSSPSISPLPAARQFVEYIAADSPSPLNTVSQAGRAELLNQLTVAELQDTLQSITKPRCPGTDGSGSNAPLTSCPPGSLKVQLLAVLFGRIQRGPHRDDARQAVVRKLGGAMQVSPGCQDGITELLRVFFVPLGFEPDTISQLMQSVDLHTVLQLHNARFQHIPPGEYALCCDALRQADALHRAAQAGHAEQCYRLVHEAASHLLSQPTWGIDPAAPLPYHSPWRVWVRNVLRGIGLLERARDFSMAMHYARVVLSVPAHITGSFVRSHCWSRLVRDLSHVVSRTSPRLIEACTEALADPCVEAEFRVEISATFTRVKQKQGNSKFTVPHCLPLRHAPEKHIKFTRGTTERVSPEATALEVYGQEGWQGLHAENSLILSVFMTICAPILSSQEGAFHHPYADTPCDLRHTSHACSEGSEAILDSGAVAADVGQNYVSQFYRLRQHAFDAILRDIRAGKSRELLVRALSEASASGCFRGFGNNMSFFLGRLGEQTLVDVVEGIGSAPLGAIFTALSRNFPMWCHGLTDLLLWRPLPPEKVQVKWVEVKGPGDRLSSQQLAWLDVLLRAGASVDVCYVHE